MHVKNTGCYPAQEVFVSELKSEEDGSSLLSRLAGFKICCTGVCVWLDGGVCRWFRRLLLVLFPCEEGSLCCVVMLVWEEALRGCTALVLQGERTREAKMVKNLTPFFWRKKMPQHIWTAVPRVLIELDLLTLLTFLGASGANIDGQIWTAPVCTQNSGITVITRHDSHMRDHHSTINWHYSTNKLPQFGNVCVIEWLDGHHEGISSNKGKSQVK